MNLTNNKGTKTARKTTITIFMLMALALPLIILPITNAHNPPVEITTYTFLSINPDPIGAGQQVSIVMWGHGCPPGASSNGGLRYIFNLNVTTPSGETQDLGEFVSDSTGSAYTTYVPKEVGEYTFSVKNQEQVITGKHPVTGIDGTPTEFINDTLLSSSRTAHLNVQEEQITKLPEVPLPTEYWTRPIAAQNTVWESIASNWVGGAMNSPLGVNVQEYGSVPMSSHVMWTLPIELGGLVGATDPIADYWGGGAYSERLTNPLIVGGRLYFQLPIGGVAVGGMGSPTLGGGYVCVDLQTGETVWQNDNINPTKAQLFDYESENQHGVVGGYLWQESGTTWSAYDAFTGKWCYNLTNVPAGKEAYTDRGEILRYVLNYDARWLALWNNTDCKQGLNWRPIGQSIDMSKAYSWNVTIPDLTGVAAPSIYYVLPGDIILGTSSSWPFTNGFFQATSNPVTMWAISDKPETRGQLLWMKNYSIPANELYSTRSLGPVDPVNRVFTMHDRGLARWIGFNLDNGNELWAQPAAMVNDLSYYIQGTAMMGAANGKLFTSSYSGDVVCYSTIDGSVQWIYNGTYSGIDTPWGHNPMLMAFITDDVLYAYNNEHSPNDPLYKNYRVHAINATTGEAIWTLLSWAGECGGLTTYALADGSLIYYNSYDGQIYNIGKGPSATAVTASPKVSVQGSSVLIEGSVIDTAAGTQQNEQETRFPYGVPAVSDESMSAWMEYVYMQQPQPANATGVMVSLDVVDSNGNFRNIGSTRTDPSGLFSYQWEPDIPGKYTVYASFAGSNSYWPSSAQTSFIVDEARTTTTPTSAPAYYATASDLMLYLVSATIAIIIAIAIVGVLLLRRRS